MLSLNRWKEQTDIKKVVGGFSISISTPVCLYSQFYKGDNINNMREKFDSFYFPLYVSDVSNQQQKI